MVFKFIILLMFLIKKLIYKRWWRPGITYYTRRRNFRISPLSKGEVNLPWGFFPVISANKHYRW